MPSPPSKDAPVIIVGAGVFGLSLAYELAAHRGYENITVLDRYMPPVPDGSSVDVSRIIRSDLERVEKPRLGGALPRSRLHYHEAGFLMLSARDSRYMKQYRDAQKPKPPVDVFEAHEVQQQVKTRYPGVQADLKGATAFHNSIGGWAHARDAIQGLATRCGLAGVSFVTGARGTVVALERAGSRIAGVETAAGTRLFCDVVVLATGAWTSSLVPDDVGLDMLAVGQPVGFIQLSPGEAKRLSAMPVMLKLARHGFGYATRVDVGDGRVVSSPKLRENNAASGYLPDDAEQALREGAKSFFPEFGSRPWANLRMCWYTDTPTSDFIVDYHPTQEELFFATGGSGHAFKFLLPVIGTQVADCFERKAAPEIRSKWAARLARVEAEPGMSGDGSRGGPGMRVMTSKEQARL
ncbi:hypothetical protein AK830_g5141 [Neonectria ditissima]|uniref:FAD dependent oxidoreductase domain-containing protein n=1 Tax=Neonectria ditissima TaxID=78410 RepID=A0A0P7BLU5_9HYPO|nr:hypothetical protein AK830_g5141 [Neonectria ditissima]